MSWRRFFRRASWDRDRAEELRSYLEIETDENIARGMSADAARRAAHLKLGNTVRIREAKYPNDLFEGSPETLTALKAKIDASLSGVSSF